MKLHELRPQVGSTKISKRVGRGIGSGTGKTAGRGENGQKSRSGYSRKFGFEGGQIPLYRRIPKRGFSNHRFKIAYATINVSDLNIFEDKTIVTPLMLKEKRLITQELNGIKVLGNGKLEKNVTVMAHQFSKSAKDKIEAAGGKIEVI